MVVVAIIAILIALLLPAIQSARESARRLDCTNHLRQIAIATQNYEAHEKRLPPSGIVDPAFATRGSQEYPVYDQQSGKMFSWTVLLLPFLGEDSLFSRFDQSFTVLEQAGDPQETFVSTFLCPSDAAYGRYYSDIDRFGEKRFAKGNYAAYVSPFHSDLQILYPAALTYGGQPLANITDGTTRTIVFSEVRTLDRLIDERGAWALPWNGATLLSFDAHPETLSASGNVVSFAPLANTINVTQTPNTRGPNQDILLSCEGEHAAESQLAGMPCLTWKWNLGLSGYISAAPRSNHLGGVSVAYLDGHVDFLSDSVDPKVMAYQVAINDGKDW
jgi:prepilin-type processing-associated H-X9-DG protein